METRAAGAAQHRFARSACFARSGPSCAHTARSTRSGSFANSARPGRFPNFRLFRASLCRFELDATTSACPIALASEMQTIERVRECLHVPFVSNVVLVTCCSCELALRFSRWA